MSRITAKIKEWFDIITGPSTEFEFEHRFMNMITLLAGITAGITLIINFALMNAIPDVLFWIISALGLLFFMEYYLSRFRNRLQLVKWITTLILFPVFSYIFVVNNGSHGPLLYLYVVYFSLIIFVWDGTERILFSILFVLNIGTFFYIELQHPEWIPAYPDDLTRLMDVYMSYMIYIFLGSPILMTAKSNYIRERRKAIQSDKLNQLSWPICPTRSGPR
jgi:hypothetical protein